MAVKQLGMQGTPYTFFVQWHLTERCNLRCRHCYQQVETPEMSYQEICQGMANVKDAIKYWVTEHGMDVSPSIHFTGGEPILSPDLFPLLDYASRIGFSTSLMSNGTLITAAIARQIRDAQVGDVQISLEGSEAVHDSIRGRGSFKRALNGINNLVSMGVDVNINLTISRINFKEVGGLVNLADELGIGAITFARLVPCGRGQGLVREMLTAEELVNIYDDIRRFRGSQKVAIFSRDPLFSIANIEEEIVRVDFPVGGCAAGVFGVTIAVDGSIMPCRRMNLTIGNIKDGLFRELWADSPVLWSLRNRNEYHGGCDLCAYWSVCRGCRAIALAFSRSSGKEDFLGPDPQCAFYKPKD